MEKKGSTARDRIARVQRLLKEKPEVVLQTILEALEEQDRRVFKAQAMVRTLERKVAGHAHAKKGGPPLLSFGFREGDGEGEVLGSSEVPRWVQRLEQVSESEV